MDDYIEIYTDGACKGNPGPGGWAAIMLYKGHTKEISGYEEHTTNNRMEIKGAIEALKSIKNDKIKIHLYTDSSYLKNGITTWVDGWKKNNWKTSTKKQVKNEDLWRELSQITERFDIEWHWVRGHADNVGNNMADELANLAIKMQNK